MGKDYWTILGSYYYSHPYWCQHIDPNGWTAGFDNPKVANLPLFRDCAVVGMACRPPPEEATGLAAWPTVQENFIRGNGHWEAIESRQKADRPLNAIFSSKRESKVLAGKVDMDKADFERWKARHPNLFVFHTLSEWDNDVNHVFWRYCRKDLKTDAERRRREEVLDYLGAKPTNRYERLKMQRKFFDRQKELYYGDTEHLGAMHANVSIGHLAAAWGARMIMLETTNTCTPPDEYRWSVSGMFVRGAARQFGLPWEWYLAVYMNGYSHDGEWTRNSVCVHPLKPGETCPREASSPVGGISRSLHRRGMYYAYLNGANMVEQEMWRLTLLAYDPSTGKIELSPRGRDFSEFHDFTAAHPDRGTPYTPVAILVPFAQGYSAFGGYSWANESYGYTPGDQTVDAVFFSLVPGFNRDAAMKRGVEGNLHNTPYAMMYDVISPDAPQKPEDLLSTLLSYKAIVLTGDYPDESFVPTLAEYKRRGGRLLRVRPDELPPIVDERKDVADILTGRRRFPAVAARLKALQDEYFPVSVTGDCLYGINRNETGWWLWCLNNNGVTKFADRDQVVDAAAESSVTVDLGRTGATKVVELVHGTTVPVENGRFAFAIPAGDLAIFELR